MKTDPIQSHAAMRVLLEMRPALDGHAGIPQETRLLFNGLRTLQGINVEGLIQSSGNVLAKGLPTVEGRWHAPLTRDKQINRLSRVVVSLQQKISNAHLAAMGMAMRRMLGGRESLGRFEATHFRDFIWRMLFARTLPYENFDAVTCADFRIARVPWTAMHRCALLTKKFGYALYPRLDTSDYDVLIVETPYPAIVSPSTTLVVRYHDAIPLLMPHTISDKVYHQASHYQALRNNVRRGGFFSCVSDATRSDLLSIFPQAEARSTTIHNMVSHHYFPDESSPARVPEVIATRRNDRIAQRGAAMDESLRGSGAQLEFLLIVSTIEPRKNHTTLLAAWEQLRTERFPNLKLVVVGMLGWGNKAIVKKFIPWMERGELFVLADVPSPELRLLYKHARATICPSFGEGFDFSGVEAMRSGGAVVASEIIVHREIYGDAAEYFSPYSIADAARAIAAVIAPERNERRLELVAKGAVTSSRYLPDRILPQWQEFLRNIRAPGVAAKNGERT
ncbi:MAG TPA: glycosyltransferase family 1 protein [Candidatus Accumulibacter phosphatis]|nr:glycosyltransferase family 1 protein [Candidatus Accumulibacter phosphatis]